MTVLGIIQVVTALVAFGMQVWTTNLARPLRPLFTANLWRVLVVLNVLVLVRRFMSLVDVSFGWSGQIYQSIEVCVGLTISAFMFLTVTLLRCHEEQERARKQALSDEADEIARATLALAAQPVRVEDSIAYKLAIKLIAQRQKDLARESGTPRKQPPK